jgi:hypothetical protein
MCLRKRVSEEKWCKQKKMLSVEEHDLMKRLIESRGDIRWKGKERIILKELDKRFDIPLIKASLETNPSYDLFVRLLHYDYSSLPPVCMTMLPLRLNQELPLRLNQELPLRLNQKLPVSPIIPSKFLKDSKLIHEAIVRNDVDIVKRAYELGIGMHVDVVQEAAKYNRVQIIQFFWEKEFYSEEDCDVVPYYASLYGHIELLEFCKDHIKPWDVYTMMPAVSAGRLDCVMYLHEHGCPWNANSIIDASHYGHVHVLQYLHEHGCPWSPVATRVAAQYGHLACLQYLHENGCPWDEEVSLAFKGVSLTFEEVGKASTKDCLRYCQEHGAPGTTCYTTMEFGKNSPVGVTCNDKVTTLTDLNVSKDDISLLEELFRYPDTFELSQEIVCKLEALDKYLDIPLVQALTRPLCFHSFHRLIENECQIIPTMYTQNKRILEVAIEEGKINTFIKSYELNADTGIYLVDLAVMHDQMPFIDFLLTRNAYEEKDEHMVCALAAKYGRLEILKSLRETYDFAWDKWAGFNAASEGHLSILMYLYENNCYLSSDAATMAAKNGYLDCLQYLVDKGCEISSNALFEAVKHGHYYCVVFLREHHGPWMADLMTTAAKYGHLAIVQYLREEGYLWDCTTFSTAARNGHLHILQYLYENHCPWNESALIQAKNHGHEDCYQWLSANMSLPQKDNR